MFLPAYQYAVLGIVGAVLVPLHKLSNYFYDYEGEKFARLKVFFRKLGTSFTIGLLFLIWGYVSLGTIAFEIKENTGSELYVYLMLILFLIPHEIGMFMGMREVDFFAKRTVDILEKYFYILLQVLAVCYFLYRAFIF